MGKIKDTSKDLTRSKHTKNIGENMLSAEFQSPLKGLVIRAENTDERRDSARRIRRAVKEDNAYREKEQEKKLFPTRAKAVAKKLIETPYHKWTLNMIKDAEEIFPKKTILELIKASEEKNK